MEPIHEYVLYTDSIKGTLKHRDTINMEYEVTLEELSRKKAEKEELDKGTGGGRSFGFFSKDTEQTKQDKRGRVDSNIEELSKLAELGSDRVECANVDLKADIERWHKNKRTDFRELFAEYSERHITYYQECLAAWQEALKIVSGSQQDQEFDES